MSALAPTFSTEAEMVEAWLQQLCRFGQDKKWTVYPETAGWDLLLVHVAGYQLGIEAKLSLNAKVLAQALSGSDSYWRDSGPDYRGVLVPGNKCQLHMTELAKALGIGILRVDLKADRHVSWKSMGLPGEEAYGRDWPSWCPSERCCLPDYIPDVSAGHASPVQLTDWKIRAIKLMIILERRGCVHRGDMKALQISPTRWTDHWNGFLDKGANGAYVRGKRTPDLKSQHPVNWAQIEADFAIWAAKLPGVLELAAA